LVTVKGYDLAIDVNTLLAAIFSSLYHLSSDRYFVAGFPRKKGLVEAPCFYIANC
jgi:hypothetical protein